MSKQSLLRPALSTSGGWMRGYSRRWCTVAVGCYSCRDWITHAGREHILGGLSSRCCLVLVVLQRSLLLQACKPCLLLLQRLLELALPCRYVVHDRAWAFPNILACGTVDIICFSWVADEFIWNGVIIGLWNVSSVVRKFATSTRRQFFPILVSCCQ